METIRISISREDVYEEVAKATDYTGSKIDGEDGEARDRILADDEDLKNLGRFWDEAVVAVNENFKEMLVSGEGDGTRYQGVLEVSKSFDKSLAPSVESTLRSAMIALIIGQWFKFANKGEAKDYFMQGAEFLTAAERLLYSRRKPSIPRD